MGRDENNVTIKYTMKTNAAVARNQPPVSMISAAFSAIIRVGALVLPPISVGSCTVGSP
jgi:hypothetical protein